MPVPTGNPILSTHLASDCLDNHSHLLFLLLGNGRALANLMQQLFCLLSSHSELLIFDGKLSLQMEIRCLAGYFAINANAEPPYCKPL